MNDAQPGGRSTGTSIASADHGLFTIPQYPGREYFIAKRGQGIQTTQIKGLPTIPENQVVDAKSADCLPPDDLAPGEAYFILHSLCTFLNAPACRDRIRLYLTTGVSLFGKSKQAIDPETVKALRKVVNLFALISLGPVPIVQSILPPSPCEK